MILKDGLNVSYRPAVKYTFRALCYYYLGYSLLGLQRSGDIFSCVSGVCSSTLKKSTLKESDDEAQRSYELPASLLLVSKIWSASYSTCMTLALFF